jgi:PAS domain S-box-containing protein
MPEIPEQTSSPPAEALEDGIVARDEIERTATALRESEERFRQFAENSSDVFWILNAHTRQLEYLNPVYEKMFGESREPIMRDIERWTELIHPEDRERGADMLCRLVAGESITVDYRIIRPNDGAVRWIRDSGFPIRDQSGTINRVAGVLQDVTADRQRTKALEDSEARFRAVANLVPDLVWSTDENGAADWFNQRWIDYTGQTIARSAGDGWLMAMHPDDRSEVARKFKAAITAGEPMRHEQRIGSANGESRWFLVQKKPLQDEKGRAIRWFAAATDIHELRTAWDDARESEERFRYLVEGAREYAIFMIDPSNTITHWNVGAERVFGWTAEEAVGQSGQLIFTPEDRERKQEQKEIATALRKGTAPDKRWHIRKDSTRIWVDGVMHRVQDAKTGALRGFAKIARDATDLRRAQEKLEERVKERTAELTAAYEKLQAEIQQRSRLEQEVLLISERERRRIGQDLHDSLCQQLAATAFLLETQAHKLNKRNPAQAKCFSEAAHAVNDNVGLARDLARGLHPIELSTAGLGNALRELTYRACHSQHLNCRFIYPRPIRIRDDAVSLNLYRIAQEAVNNAIKHGKPTELTVSLTRKRSSLVLEVSDNGTGFSEKQCAKGMGIDIMQHRANVIGGKLTVASRDGRGTTVTCTLPGE